jgi:hypothetical protein
MRFGFLASTALVLVLTASTSASAAPQTSETFQAPPPTTRGYSTPSATVDDGIRFRDSMQPADGTATAACACRIR